MSFKRLHIYSSTNKKKSQFSKRMAHTFEKRDFFAILVEDIMGKFCKNIFKFGPVIRKEMSFKVKVHEWRHRGMRHDSQPI